MSENRRLDAPGATVFFTVVTERRRPIFNDPAAVNLLRAALGRVVSDHPFTIDAIVIMPDHVHAIWTIPPGDDRFGLRWSAIKAAFTRAYLAGGGHETRRSASRMARNERGVWQRRLWDHVIRDDLYPKNWMCVCGGRSVRPLDLRSLEGRVGDEDDASRRILHLLGRLPEPELTHEFC